jgi:hypothetical protein
MHYKGEHILEKITFAFLIIILVIAFTVPFSPASPDQAKIYVNPPSIINTGISPGQNITIDIMVANVTDLYTWQINLTFTPSILNCTQASPPTENVFGHNYWAPPADIENAKGYVSTGASLTGQVPGISTSKGNLTAITFKVKARGCILIHLSTYEGSTYLLDSNFPQNDIPRSTQDGYFSNTILGDVNGDGKVDLSDLSVLSTAYGSNSSNSNWNPVCDLNLDGKVDASDLFNLSKNYGKHI